MNRIKVNIGITKNLGNYESLRVDVGIEKDVEEATTIEKEKVYKETMRFLEAAVTKAQKEVT